jgi:hypothetical protein
VLFLERTSRATLAPVVLKFAVKPVDPALFLSDARPGGTPVPISRSHVSHFMQVPFRTSLKFTNAPTLKT